MSRRSVVVLLALLIAFPPLVACGGKNPVSPSGKGAVVRGIVLREGASASAPEVSAQSGSANTITVAVQQNTSITTTVSTNGTFELEGVPDGHFTLVFSSNTTVLGTVEVSGVPEDGDVHIVVQVTVVTIVVINITINGVPVPHPRPGDDDDDDDD